MQGIINDKKYNNVFVFVINIQRLIALCQMQIKSRECKKFSNSCKVTYVVSCNLHANSSVDLCIQ